MLLALLSACSAPDDDVTVRRARAGAFEQGDAHEPGPDTARPADTGAPPDTGPAPDTAVDDTAPQDTDTGPLQACYLGPARDHAVCLSVVAWSSAWGSDYDYPSSSDPAYVAPARYVDIEAYAADLDIAPNFVLEEYMASYKGRYGVMQTHIVDLMQAIRDDVGGPVSVNSGYRNPSYNAGVGGVEYSRHQYGDAVDLDVSGLSADGLGDICDAHGADYVATYSTGHTHCDWRYHDLDPVFYDANRRPPPPAAPPRHDAALVMDGGAWTAPATGFDEGEPLRTWTAYDAKGRVLVVAEGASFAPPPGAARVRVDVGRQVVVERDL